MQKVARRPAIELPLFLLVMAVILSLATLLLRNYESHGAGLVSPNTGTLAGRLLLTLGLSALIGMERECRQKPAGIRTIAMVGIGSCLFGLVALETFASDPATISRVVQGVVTGIGFLGAGTIIKEGFTKHSVHVEGLTTAATLWAVAGLGLAVSLGHYTTAVLGTATILLVLIVLHIFERRDSLREEIADAKADQAENKDEHRG